MAGVCAAEPTPANEVPRPAASFSRICRAAARAGRLSTPTEVVTNIVRHAYEGEGGHDILLGITVDHGLVTAVVEDQGPPFDLRTVPPADIDAPVERRPIGGLGVHLVRSLTHGLDYRRDGDRNILTLRFMPAPPSPA